MRAPDPKQRWLTFVHNHAKEIVASDFFVVITATFRTPFGPKTELIFFSRDSEYQRGPQIAAGFATGVKIVKC